jgi:glycosyltransferase involved in cell wall biosynthesis
MAATRRLPRLCFVTAVPLTLRAFFTSHVRFLAPDYDITLVSSGSASDVPELLVPNVTFRAVPIERQIAPRADLASLRALFALFRRERFDSVHSMTPKAGLLAMLAARGAGIPNRVHTFTGQVWATRTGPGRTVLKTADRVLASSATRLLADSASQRQFLIDNGIAPAKKVQVLGDGSVAGVELTRFRPNPDIRASLRQQLGIPEDAVGFVFIGRLNRDKGIAEMAAAFAVAAGRDPRPHLIVAGPDEDGAGRELAALRDRFPGRIHVCDYVARPEEYLAAADVLLLQSHREGFGVVVIEAAAAGLPAIASRIYGVTDAVQDGVTGLLHPVAAVPEIADAISRLTADPALRERLGGAARARVVASFSRERISEAFAAFYRDMLGASA